MLIPLYIKAINHTEAQLKVGQAEKAQRFIFYETPYDEFELQQIQSISKQIQDSETLILPLGWTDTNTLKFLYSGQFNHKKCMENIQKHLDWLRDPLYHELTATSEKMLVNYMVYVESQGMVYQFGRDRRMRPVIIFNIPKINAELKDVDSVIQAICYLLTMVKSKMLYPYHVENWQVIMDINNLGMFSLPVQAITRIIEVTQINFSSMMTTLFILKPSFALKAGWHFVKQMLSAVAIQKIKFLEVHEYSQILEQIGADQLEIKYGGTAPNLTEFWPFSALQEKSRYHIAISPLRIKTHVSIRSQHVMQELETDQQHTINSNQFFSLGGNTNRFQFHQKDLEIHSLALIENPAKVTNDTQIDIPQTSKCCFNKDNTCTLM